MKKIFLQIILVVSFFALWFTLSRVDWMTLFKVEKIAGSTEEKLGELFWELYHQTGKEISNKEAISALDSILTKMCDANGIDRTEIKLHLIESDEINAFALPDKHLVVCSGLVLSSENEEELCGVMGHELAHIQLNHVMKKLIKEVGLSVLISITTGKGSSENIREVAKLLSSSAYDRSLEREADIRSVDYMKNSGIDPEHFANFLFRLGDSEAEGLKYFSWISTHPDSKERAEYIIGYCGKKNKDTRPVLKSGAWEELKKYLAER
jgi:beta-barrel assembly-enhancing protease